MNLETIITNSRMRDNAVSELCKAIDELDAPAVERVLAYAAVRLAEFVDGARRAQLVDLAGPSGPLAGTSIAMETAKRIARAEKGVATRKRNAAKKGAKHTVSGKHNATPKSGKRAALKTSTIKSGVPMSPLMARIVGHVTGTPGQTGLIIAGALKVNASTVSSYLSEAKKAKRLYNEAGKWYPTQRQKNALNGAPATP